MRNYSAVSGAMSLTGGVSASDTSITLDTVVGLPSSFPYSLVLDPGQASEEIVQVSAAAGSTLTVSRGYDGTSAQSHSLGATVRHMMIPMDLREPQQHIAATADVHGVTGALVGERQAQVLDRKTFQSTDGTTTPVAVQKQTGQSKDLVQFKDESGNVMWSVPSDGGSFVSDGAIIRNGASANFFKRVIDAVASAKDVVGIMVKGYAGQTANLQEWQKSDGTVLSSIDKDGKITAPDVTATGTAWTDVTVNAGFAAQSSPERPQVRRIGNAVYARGAWGGTGISANGTFDVGVVPAGFIPPVSHIWGAGTASGAATASIRVTNGGTVQIRTGASVSGYYFFSTSWLID